VALSDKIKNSIKQFYAGEFEQSFEQVMIAADATAKKVYQEIGNRNKERMERFFHDNMEMITGLGMQIYLSSDITMQNSDSSSGESLKSILYKYIRCGILHEAEIDPIVELTDNTFGCINGKYLFPKSLFIGICLAVVVNKVNAKQWIRNDSLIYRKNKEMDVNNYWGKEERLKKDFGFVANCDCQ